MVDRKRFEVGIDWMVGGVEQRCCGGRVMGWEMGSGRGGVISHI